MENFIPVFKTEKFYFNVLIHSVLSMVPSMLSFLELQPFVLTITINGVEFVFDGLSEFGFREELFKVKLELLGNTFEKIHQTTINMLVHCRFVRVETTDFALV